MPLRFTGKSANSGKAVLSAAIYYLSRRPYTACELEAKLSARGADPRHVEEALAALKERGWLDEEKLAEAHIYHRSVNSLRGPFCVRRELLLRGLDRELTESALARWYDEEAERRAVNLFLDKELRGAPIAPDEEKAWDKLRRKLAGRGFSLPLIDECLSLRKDVSI